MGGTYSIVLGDRGRLVIPVDLRERWHLDAGSRIVLIETPEGIVLTTRD
jgi:AbrB family looped-hinge helix DNA binding protein